jgi:hypothetical protein
MPERTYKKRSEQSLYLFAVIDVKNPQQDELYGKVSTDH